MRQVRLAYIDPFGLRRYMTRMIIGYGIDCDPTALRTHGAERVWVDTSRSERAERAALFSAGLQRGDTLLLLSRAHLGRGREIPRFEALAADMGVTIRIAQIAKPAPLKPGPAPSFVPTRQQELRIRHYWHGPFKRSEAVRQAGEIMGGRVSVSSLNRHLGPRSKPRPLINKEPKG